MGLDYSMILRKISRKPPALPWLAAGILIMQTSCLKKPPAAGQVQEGIASWYGHPFDGRPTASGEIFDMEKKTAAHRTLPFGTVVRVRSLSNEKTAEVRINDRGPFVEGRIIDLSHGAAQEIAMQGIANVRLEIISVPSTRAADFFAVQIGAFASQKEADQLRATMERKYGRAQLVFREGDQTWRVLVGLQPTIEGADELAGPLGREAGPAFVVRIDSQ